MATSAKAVAGIGGLLATVTVPSTYLAISSSSSNGGSTSEVETGTTGEAWLLNSGYKPNKPTFKSQDHLRHGCSENLFSNDKKEADPTKDSKLYGCAVMSMDLGHTGAKFNYAKDPKYIKFNSEVAIRKGDEGWVINSRVDNWSDWSTLFNYMLTSYKYKNDQWEKEGESKLWSDPVTMSGSSVILELHQADQTTESINFHDKKLVIKTPQGSWWDSQEWIAPSADAKTKTKQSLETKHWSGAWIHNENEGSWIFQDIELYMDDKKYSQVFCKGEEGECFQDSKGNSHEKIRKPKNLETWSANTQSPQNTTEKVQEMVTKDIKAIIEKLKNLKGKWMDMEEVCDLKQTQDPTEEQQNRLRMYCSNGKKQEQA